MHYNIALLPKKVTYYVTWLLFMESNALRYFRVTFELWAGLDCLFLIQEVIFIANVKAFHTKKCNE